MTIRSNSFKYDPLGRRTQKVFTQNSTTTTTNYVYDGHDAAEEVDQNGNVLAKYARTMNVDGPLAESRPGGTSYYEADGLGSITSLTNGTGALAQTYTFDSFGKLTASAGSITNPFRHTGREFDSETSLYFYRAREYDPFMGRFLSEDPLQFGSGDANFYRFVLNGPVNFRDPTGYSCQCTYSISSGSFVCYGWGPHFVGPLYINSTGYSGYPPYVNNPFYDNVPNVGPIPIGPWTFGPGYNGSKGQAEFNLTPIDPGSWFPSNRDPGPFLIHADNPNHPGKSSNGCIVLDLKTRKQLQKCDGGTLQVTP